MKVKVESKFLKIDNNINDGDIVKILDEGTLVSNKFDAKKKDLQFTVETPGGEEKLAKFSGMSKTNFIKEYGDDTVAWKGKEARVNILRDQMIAGELKDMIVFTHPNKTLKGEIIVKG